MYINPKMKDSFQIIEPDIAGAIFCVCVVIAFMVSA